MNSIFTNYKKERKNCERVNVVSAPALFLHSISAPALFLHSVFASALFLRSLFHQVPRKFEFLNIFFEVSNTQMHLAENTEKLPAESAKKIFILRDAVNLMEKLLR